MTRRLLVVGSGITPRGDLIKASSKAAQWCFRSYID